MPQGNSNIESLNRNLPDGSNSKNRHHPDVVLRQASNLRPVAQKTEVEPKVVLLPKLNCEPCDLSDFCARQNQSSNNCPRK